MTVYLFPHFFSTENLCSNDYIKFWHGTCIRKKAFQITLKRLLSDYLLVICIPAYARFGKKPFSAIRITKSRSSWSCHVLLSSKADGARRQIWSSKKVAPNLLNRDFQAEKPKVGHRCDGVQLVRTETVSLTYPGFAAVSVRIWIHGSLQARTAGLPGLLTTIAESRQSLRGLPPAIHRQQALSAAWIFFAFNYCLTFWGHFTRRCRVS